MRKLFAGTGRGGRCGLRRAELLPDRWGQLGVVSGEHSEREHVSRGDGAGHGNPRG